MTSLNDPLAVLRAILVMFAHDYGASRNLALAFWQRGNVAVDDVAIWRELNAVAFMFAHDGVAWRDLALAFSQRGNVAVDDVDAVWREYWGRGLFDDDE